MQGILTSLSGTSSRVRRALEPLDLLPPIHPDPADPGCRGIDGSLPAAQRRDADPERSGDLRRCEITRLPDLEHPPVTAAVLVAVDVAGSTAPVVAGLKADRLSTAARQLCFSWFSWSHRVTSERKESRGRQDRSASRRSLTPGASGSHRGDTGVNDSKEMRAQFRVRRPMYTGWPQQGGSENWHVVATFPSVALPKCYLLFVLACLASFRRCAAERSVDGEP